ncbi:MAG: divergent PAP2 family protein [Candidatus Andersenbacteria bacterium]
MASSLWPILLPILTTGLTQLIKVLVDLARTGTLEPNDFFKWGGFPSSHAALVACLATVVGILSGWYSAQFAIALGFGVLVLRDAMGLRMFVQRNSLAINQLRTALSGAQRSKIAEQEHSVGHTPTQVVGGVVLGVAVALAWYYFLGF